MQQLTLMALEWQGGASLFEHRCPAVDHVRRIEILRLAIEAV